VIRPIHAELGSTTVQQYRGKAHRVFDRLWKNNYQRSQAYTWLAKQMGLSRKECHISMFTIEQCKEVIHLVTTLQPTIPDRDPSEKRFERRKVGESIAV